MRGYEFGLAQGSIEFSQAASSFVRDIIDINANEGQKRSEGEGLA